MIIYCFIAGDKEEMIIDYYTMLDTEAKTCFPSIVYRF